MLACIALTLATVIIYKNKKQKLYCLVTALPLIFITFTTTSAVLMKVFSSDIKIGFLASANALKEKLLFVATHIIFNENIKGLKKR